MEPMTSEELFEWCCNQNCEPYSNCDLCMYEKGRKDAIDEFENLLYQFGHYESFSLKFEIYQEDLKRLIQQLKEQK